MSEADEAWDYDAQNSRRPFCGLKVIIPMPLFWMGCDGTESDDIPF